MDQLAQQQLPQHRSIAHAVVAAAPAETLYRLVEDVSRWPRLFDSITEIERLADGGGRDRLRLTATTPGGTRSWVSVRTLDAAALRIGFRQESPEPPLTAMSGTWSFRRLPGGTTTEVTLTHEFATDPDRADTGWIEEMVDRTATGQLAAVRLAAEAAPAPAHTYQQSNGDHT
jgi:aromatase